MSAEREGEEEDLEEAEEEGELDGNGVAFASLTRPAREVRHQDWAPATSRKSRWKPGWQQRSKGTGIRPSIFVRCSRSACHIFCLGGEIDKGYRRPEDGGP